MTRASDDVGGLGLEILETPIQNYDWGSREFIAAMQGRPTPTDSPEAELWIGDHPRAPASVRTNKGVFTLPDVIVRAPIAALGRECNARFGPHLPFLAKVLAAGRPLSLQVHPDREQAKSGFDGEQKREVPLSDPRRTYPDSNRKIELMIAIEPFWALSGFRANTAVDSLIDHAELPTIRKLRAECGPTLQVASSLFFALRELDDARRAQALNELRVFAARHSAELTEAGWVATLIDLYPGDIGAVAPLLLNLVRLDPGQGLFVRPGTLHSYLSGNGFEVMSSSDNVIRGGLTSKHVDTNALEEIVDHAPMAPEIIDPQPVEDGVVEFALGDKGVDEFAVRMLELGSGFEAVSLTHSSVQRPAILICTEGSVRLRAIDPATSHSQDIELRAGNAAWIPACLATVEIRPSTENGIARLFEVQVP